MVDQSLKSTPDRYGRVARGLHRTLSILIGLQIVGGLIALGDSEAGKIGILKLHAPLGMLIGVLAAARIVWWIGFDRRPDDVAGMTRLQSLAAHGVHGLLYALPLAAVFTGSALLSRSGASAFVFGHAEGAFPDLRAAAGFGAHGTAVMLLILFIAVHILATIYHEFIKQDHLTARMRRDDPTPITAPADAEISAGSQR